MESFPTSAGRGPRPRAWTDPGRAPDGFGPDLAHALGLGPSAPPATSTWLASGGSPGVGTGDPGASAARTTRRRRPDPHGGPPPDRPRRFGRDLDRWDAVIAVGIAVAAMTVALVFRSALVPTDPWHYVQGALAFPHGGWRPEGLSRWGYLLPLIPFARLWGDATATYYVLPLLSTGVLAAVTYLLGTRQVNRVAGALGTLLALATPLVFVNLTRGYTDLTATTLSGAALLLAVLARDLAQRRDPHHWGRALPALLVACGVALGWSVEVRETAVFTWPVVVWVLWRVGQPRRVAGYVLGPIAAWLLLDLVLQWLVYGDPLLKLRWVLGADISQSEVVSDGVYVGHSRWWYATVLLRSVWGLTGGPALVLCVLVGIGGGFALRRYLGPVWAWGMLALVPLWLQGGVLDPGHPSVRLDVARYWLSFLVPLMLTTAGVLVIVVSRAREWGRWVSGGVAALLCLGLLVPSLVFLRTYPGFAPNGGDALSQLRTELTARQLPADARIWADWGTQRVLPAYQSSPFGEARWSAASFRSINHLLIDEPRASGKYPGPGDYVVLYSDTDRTCWHCRRALGPAERAFGPFPAPGWELLFTSSTGNLRLFRLGPTVVWPQSHSTGEVDSEDSDESEPGL